MTIIIQNYVTWVFNETAQYGSLYLGQADLAFLAYDIIDCGMKNNAEWYKVAIRYVTEEDFRAADRRRKNVLYG